MFDQIIANASTGGRTISGEAAVGEAELAALQKSLTANYGTDVATLTGGSSLRIQSLDTTMQATIQDNEHFKLFNRLAKPSATATVDEWTEQYSVGGFLGGSTNVEDGAAMETQGDYARMTGRVKYLMSYRKISMVLQAQNNIVSAEGVEAANGAKQLLTDIEYLLWEGDEAVVPTEFSGLKAQLLGLNITDNVVDMAGQPLNSVEPISLAAQTIFGFGNFGTPTDIFMSLATQTDLNNELDPAFRIALTATPNAVSLGTHVGKIQTSYGAINTQQDVFIRDEPLMKPFELRYPAVAAANISFKPQAAVPVAATGPVNTLWGAAHAGNYYYGVAGINKNGQSAVLVTAQVAVAASQKVTLTITGSAAATETGYVIYRGRKNGTNAVADLREMKRIPVTPGGTTVFVDLNTDIPGSTNAYVLNLKPSDHAISWKQYLPMMKIPMAAVNSPIIPWLQMICGYLRITKRRQHVLIKNIVPSAAIWKPFV